MACWPVVIRDDKTAASVGSPSVYTAFPCYSVDAAKCPIIGDSVTTTDIGHVLFARTEKKHRSWSSTKCCGDFPPVSQVLL